LIEPLLRTTAGNLHVFKTVGEKTRGQKTRWSSERFRVQISQNSKQRQRKYVIQAK
jgi:hypothetical protein